ncbi:MAG TPA: PaaI family thioesterase [Planctomycetota bacterium]|jgi:uncharacterized protein (TIGR00369 family)|nr:PaaI family thioesterase [Planctomycetota bacterium]
MNRKPLLDGPLPASHDCFVCGRDNPHGFRARLERRGEEVVARLAIPERFQGYPGTAHGGVVAALLDEALAWVMMVALRRFCVTAELSVRFARPVPTGTPLVVRARAGDGRARGLRAAAVLESEAGEALATADARLAPLLRGRTDRMRGFLLYGPGTLRVFNRPGRPIRPGPDAPCGGGAPPRGARSAPTARP